ncbi:HNH endonuclease signature motif containing protein [Nocardioides ginsengisoli]|uniref:HNH endonuclease signature motif containing protein n=1 Tax=Nocardioides ginsengisoli TaxID=363868 RepID=A0ABW3W3C1_9ACTN
MLGGRGEVLDLGRGRRLFSRAQRRALRLRDRGCRAEGCTIPAAWTEAHHLRPWSEGGPTDRGNAISLCGRHHHLVRDRRYAMTSLPDGDVRFHRRT